MNTKPKSGLKHTMLRLAEANLIGIVLLFLVYLLTTVIVNILTPEYEKSKFEHYDFEFSVKRNLDGLELENITNKCVALRADKYELSDIESKMLAKYKQPDVIEQTLRVTKILNCSSIFFDTYSDEDIVIYD